MKNVLFIARVSLKDPNRGTPLRIYNFLLQIKKRHNLFVMVDDVRESDGFNYLSLGRLSQVNKIKAIGKIIRENKIDIVMTATESTIKLPVILKLLYRVKIAVDIHGVLADELYFFKKISLVKKYWIAFKIRFWLMFYNHFFAVSQSLVNHYSLFRNKGTVIYGGVNLLEFPQAQLKASDTLTIGYTGNARNYQGLYYLTEAVSKLYLEGRVNCELKLILSNKDEAVVDKLKEYKIEAITQLIFDQTHDKIADIINDCDVLVIPRPSLIMTELAYPSKMTEFLATGIPVIMTNVGPVREIKEISDIAIIIESDNLTENLYQALVKFFEINLDERVALGQAARDYVAKNLTWQKLGEKINQTLDQI